MTGSNTQASGVFSRGFLPGLVLGIVVGVIVTFISTEVIGKRPKIEPGISPSAVATHTQGDPREQAAPGQPTPEEIQRMIEESKKAAQQQDQDSDPDATPPADAPDDGDG